MGTMLWAEDGGTYCDLILLRMWVLGILPRMGTDSLAVRMCIVPQGLPELPRH